MTIMTITLALRALLVAGSAAHRPASAPNTPLANSAWDNAA